MSGGVHGEPTSDPPRLARRVITGLTRDGRSAIVADSEVPTWLRRVTGSVVMDVWRADALPVNMADEVGTGDELIFALAPGGLAVRVAVFPPDKDVDSAAAAAHEASLREIYGDQGDAAASRAPGTHRTETVDVVTVVDGEIWVVLEDGETLLQHGDTLVQRGTLHAWQNRSDRPCTLATVMVAAVRSSHPEGS
jgi:hypothetical protein